LSLVAFDTETRGLDWFDPNQRAFLVSWTDARGSHVEPIEGGAPRFREAVAKATTLVAHNLAFDVHQVRESLGIDLLTLGKKLVDTDLLARVALPERRFAKGADPEHGGHGELSGYKLKDLAKTYLKADAGAAEEAIIALGESIGVKLKGENATIGGYYEVWRAYAKEMEEYALLDAEYARDLLPIFERKLSANQARAWDLEQRTSPSIIRAEQRGVAVDQEVVAALRAEYQPLAEQGAATVAKALGVGEDELKGDKLAEALLAHGVPLHKTTNTGKLATNKFALQEFADDFPVIQGLFDWRQAEKFLSTYIEPMEGRESVHPSFWQMGAWTSRMSCSRPNMQNIPTRAELGSIPVRAAFVPRPGYCFVVCDYDSIELRLLAYFLNDPGFKQLIEDGYDAFAWLAAEIETDGHPYEYYLKGAPGEKIRGDYKNVTYAICYGAGGRRVSDMLNLDPGPFYGEDHPAIVKARNAGKEWPRVGYQYAEGRKVANKVKATLPRYDILQKRIRNKIRQVGFVSTLYGHKQVIDWEKKYIALNALIQGSAAGIFKDGLIATEAAIAPLGAYPVMLVHDEIGAECPIEHAEECLPLMQRAMAEAFDLSPALKVSGSIAYENYSQGK
jgi:DNA polymerase-1